MREMMRQLGFGASLPLIGYVFDQDWADDREADVLAFFRASQKARDILAESDAEWEDLRPLMKV